MKPWTVGRRLREVGIRSFIATQKDFLTNRHKQLRLEFALRYVNEPNDYWKNVFFRMKKRLGEPFLCCFFSRDINLNNSLFEQIGRKWQDIRS